MNIYVESYLTDEEELLEGHQQRNRDRLLGVWAKQIWRFVPTIRKNRRDEATEKNYYRIAVNILDGEKSEAYRKFMFGMEKAQTVEEKGVLAAMFFSALKK